MWACGVSRGPPGEESGLPGLGETRSDVKFRGTDGTACVESVWEWAVGKPGRMLGVQGWGLPRFLAPDR